MSLLPLTLSLKSSNPRRRLLSPLALTRKKLRKRLRKRSKKNPPLVRKNRNQKKLRKKLRKR